MPARAPVPGVNRRTLLAAGAGGLAAVAGGAALADATRADVAADRQLTRGEGDRAALERTVARESVEYLEATDEVEADGRTVPFEEWARREAAEVGADAVVGVVEDRLDRSLRGVGSGVRYLLFGPVVTLDHTVTRNREGEVVNEPDVPLETLVAVAPRRLAVTVVLEGRSSTARFPVGVGHVEVSYD